MHAITGSYAVLFRNCNKYKWKVENIIETVGKYGETNTSLILAKSSKSSFIKDASEIFFLKIFASKGVLSMKFLSIEHPQRRRKPAMNFFLH